MHDSSYYDPSSSENEYDHEVEFIAREAGSLPGGLERQPLVCMPEASSYNLNALCDQTRGSSLSSSSEELQSSFSAPNNSSIVARDYLTEEESPSSNDDSSGWEDETDKNDDPGLQYEELYDSDDSRTKKKYGDMQKRTKGPTRSNVHDETIIPSQLCSVLQQNLNFADFSHMSEKSAIPPPGLSDASAKGIEGGAVIEAKQKPGPAALEENLGIGEPFTIKTSPVEVLGERQENGSDTLKGDGDFSVNNGNEPAGLSEISSKLAAVASITQQTEALRGELTGQLAAIQREMGRLQEQVRGVRDQTHDVFARQKTMEIFPELNAEEGNRLTHRRPQKKKVVSFAGDGVVCSEIPELMKHRGINANTRLCCQKCNPGFSSVGWVVLGEDSTKSIRGRTLSTSQKAGKGHQREYSYHTASNTKMKRRNSTCVDQLKQPIPLLQLLFESILDSQTLFLCVIVGLACFFIIPNLVKVVLQIQRDMAADPLI